MRITLAHNFYSSKTPSGENAVFETEKKLLEERNHEVSTFTKYSDEIHSSGLTGKIKAAILTPWNSSIRREIQEHIKKFKPEVIHVHNTFPLISPSIFHAIGSRAARVITLHNYRIVCPAAIPSRSGRTCTKCIDDKSVKPALIHGCYRGSRIATIPLASNVALHRIIKTWKNHVDAFITLSEFQKNLMASAGLPAEKIHVKPNFYPGSPEKIKWTSRSPYIVFAGRLSHEKGVISLLRAWQEWGLSAPELRIVGDGDLRYELEKMAVGLPVRFLGQLPAESAQNEIANARLQILPSEWFEGFPMVVREAFAFGTPAAVSKIGPLPSIVQHGKSGIVFEPANPQSLLHEVRTAWETPGLLERLGQGARAEFESKYTEEANYATLMDIYRKAIEVSRNG